MTQIILQWQMHLTLNIQHRVVANYLRTGRCGKLKKRGYEKRQVDDAKRQELMRLIDDNPIRYLNAVTDER